MTVGCPLNRRSSPSRRRLAEDRDVFAVVLGAGQCDLDLTGSGDTGIPSTAIGDRVLQDAAIAIRFRRGFWCLPPETRLTPTVPDNLDELVGDDFGCSERHAGAECLALRQCTGGPESARIRSGRQLL